MRKTAISLISLIGPIRSLKDLPIPSSPKTQKGAAEINRWPSENCGGINTPEKKRITEWLVTEPAERS